MADASGDESRSPSGASGSIIRRARINGRSFEFTIDGMIVKGPSSVIGKYVCGEQLADILNESSCKAHLYLADSIDQVRLARDEYRLAQLKESAVSHHSFKINQVVEYHGDHWTITSRPNEAGHLGSFRLQGIDGKVLSVAAGRFYSEAKIVESSDVLPAQQHNPYDLDDHTESEQQTFAGSLVIEDDVLIDTIQQKVNELFEARMEEFLDKCAERIARTIESSGNESPGDLAIQDEHKE